MASKPLVSIIIPVYNAELFLEETINCALAQDWPNKEILLVDDGSTDHSYKIAKKFESEIVKVFKQENRGGSAARNYGLREAKGEYIQFLDADDLMPTDKISLQMGILLENPDCLIGCRWIRFENSLDQVFGKEGPEDCLRRNLKPTDWLLCLHTMLLHCWLTPRKLINKAGKWDERINQNDDGEFFYRVVGRSLNVLFCNDTIVYYRSGIKGSVSAQKSRQKYYSEYLAALTYKSVLRTLCIGKVCDIKIGNNFKKLAVEAYPRYPEVVKLCKEQPEYIVATYSPASDKGLTGKIMKLIGWKLTKTFKYYFFNK